MIARRVNLCISIYLVLVAAAAPARSAEPPLLQVIKARIAPEWNARFATSEGWIGGDGVYSTVLHADRVLFLFGDTLIGAVRDGRRAGAKMINNTVGLLPIKSDQASIRFVTGRTDSGEPAAVFRPADGQGWFWPQGTVQVEGRLFVFLAQIEKTSDDGVFGFKQIGQVLAVIQNPSADPAKWSIEQRRVPFAEFEGMHERVWGSAVLADDDYVYIYGVDELGKKLGSKQLIVARAPLDKLSDFAAWRFGTSDGWSEKPAAESLAPGLANEFSVSRLPGGGYLLVYTENGLSDRILGRVAAAPAGPWSEPTLLYRCPEMADDKGVFCYAAKAHPWATEAKEHLLSYCTNTWDFGRLFEDNAVYRPKFVRVRLAVGPSSGFPCQSRD